MLGSGFDLHISLFHIFQYIAAITMANSITPGYYYAGETNRTPDLLITNYNYIGFNGFYIALFIFKYPLHSIHYLLE
jgi:hypothetical protein